MDQSAVGGRGVITIEFRLLTAHPDQPEKIHRSPDLATAAAEEVVQCEPPVSVLER